LQFPPKFTQIGIFGLKINHLAALAGVRMHTIAKWLLPSSDNHCFVVGRKGGGAKDVSHGPFSKVKALRPFF
jgi:hypothetical protein